MKNLNVVLHRSIYPRNVGMCARAMANMAAARLVLVNPRCDHRSDEAKQGAAHAQEILASATVYADQASFESTEGEGIRIALSGRSGSLLSPTNLDTQLEEFGRIPKHPFRRMENPVYLIFGPEDDGLSNEEMRLCHHVCRLPTLGEITSLNLSHAVLLAVYLAQAARIRLQSTDEETPKFEPGPVYYPSQTIHRWLETLGFDLSSKRVNIEHTLNRFFLSHCPSPEELRLVDKVLHQTIRKLAD